MNHVCSTVVAKNSTASGNRRGVVKFPKARGWLAGVQGSGRAGLFDRDALGEVPGLVHVAAPAQGDVVGEELERDGRQDGGEQVGGFWNGDDVAGDLAQITVPLLGDSDDASLPGFHLFDVSHHLFINLVAENQGDHGKVLVDESDGTVL